MTGGGRLQRFRRQTGLNENQYRVLRKSSDGLVRPSDIDIGSLHSMCRYGILEFVGDRTWRLTDKGHEAIALADAWS